MASSTRQRRRQFITVVPVLLLIAIAYSYYTHLRVDTTVPEVFRSVFRNKHIGTKSESHSEHVLPPPPKHDFKPGFFHRTHPLTSTVDATTFFPTTFTQAHAFVEVVSPSSDTSLSFSTTATGKEGARGPRSYTTTASVSFAAQQQRTQSTLPPKPAKTSVADHSFNFDRFPLPTGAHPIDDLVRSANGAFHTLLNKQTHTLEEAARAYREKRGRHPPPGFEEWFTFAQEKSAVVIEDLFDRIYQDVEPFWAVSPRDIRHTATTWHMLITIRNGTSKVHAKFKPPKNSWIMDWYRMVSSLNGYLPDVDLAFNGIDEPRILVPWEDMNKLLEKAAKHRDRENPTSKKRLIKEYQSLKPLEEGVYSPRLQGQWQDWHNHTKHWVLARKTCHPDSIARQIELDETYTTPPTFPEGYPKNSYHGFVANWTFAKSPCDNPHLRDLHGNFVRPRFISINQTLWPLFGGSKIEGMNNEILFPAAKYWNSGPAFNGPEDDAVASPWTKKFNRVVWRGAGTGGDHTAKNWRRFQRHRFISMMNGTQVQLTQHKLEAIDPLEDVDNYLPRLPHNFPLPNLELYPVAAMLKEPSQLGEWIDSLCDGAFVHYMCFPQALSQFTDGNRCRYLKPYYQIGNHMKMAEQFQHKYLPDIDGNSYSGRWRAFLRSGSLPIKATIYAEWHDSRLIPWAHFVPMDNTFVDWFSILEYFVGYKKEVQGHDDVAQMIAETGRDWAQRVLRHEDMLIYVYRLVLEWARITNDRRDDMGWADDLM